MQDIDLKQCKKICDGVYQKSDKIYYILCSISKQPCFCAKERLDILVKKHGSLEKVGTTYISRDAKRLAKLETPVHAIQRMEVPDIKEEARIAREDEKKEREESREEREKRMLEKEKTSSTRIIYTPAEPKIFILNTPENINMATKDGCYRIDIYLNGNKFCDTCHLAEHCIAPCRRFLRKK